LVPGKESKKITHRLERLEGKNDIIRELRELIKGLPKERVKFTKEHFNEMAENISGKYRK
jgi:hypothetical protein